MDKQETCDSQQVIQFIEKYVEGAVLERESSAELIFGIRRDESKSIDILISALDEHRETIGINAYGLSMTTMEDVFLK